MEKLDKEYEFLNKKMLIMSKTLIKQNILPIEKAIIRRKIEKISKRLSRIRYIKPKICALCGMKQHTNKHHLIPKTTHSNKRIKRDFDHNKLHETVELCNDCHKEIHKQFTEKELATKFNSVKKIKSHPVIKRYIKWLTKKKYRRSNE